MTEDILDQLKEHIASGNWPLAAGRVVQVIAEAARTETVDPQWVLYDDGAEAMKQVSIELLRDLYRKMSREPEKATTLIGTALEALKRFDVAQIRSEQNAETGTATRPEGGSQ
jgi:hypothetical protein